VLKRIEKSPFQESGLVSICIPKSVEIIGGSGFYECPKLREVTFEPGSRLRKIGPNAFNRCPLLFKVCVPTDTAIEKNVNIGEEDDVGPEFSFDSTLRTAGV
jgi:hypothetical protein